MTRAFSFVRDSTTLPGEPVIFADGTAPNLFRENYDLELSHWIPNHTPEILRADTSTQICLNFLGSPFERDQKVVYNTHTDSDGVLSVFSLLFPDLARKNRKLLIETAAMGDFGAWGDNQALSLWIALVSSIHGKSFESEEDCYKNGFQTIELALSGDFSRWNSQINTALETLDQRMNWMKSGKILRESIQPRLTHFHIPYSLVRENPQLSAHYAAVFDSGIEHNQILPRQIRNRDDAQKLQLISTQTQEGTCYDLLIPQYMWAQTPNSWRLSGFESDTRTNSFVVRRSDLTNATILLNKVEKNPGKWLLANTINPFGSVKGRGFPVILSFVNQAAPANSSLKPGEVLSILSESVEVDGNC
jgi:hypothetical protein